MCISQAAAPATSSLDPDLQQAYQRASRTNNGRGAPPSTQMVRQQQVMAEQRRRDELRAANERLAEQRRAAQAQIAEQQQQAQDQQEAELQRQEGLRQQANEARIAQEQQIGRERLGTQAMAASMRVLGMQGQTSAPTAAMSSRRAPRQARTTAATQTLRIGESRRAPGAGLNIGG